VHWTEYISAIVLPIIAGIAAWIAFRQSQIARNKLKLDLFDKRMAVYGAVREALGSIARQGGLTDEQQFFYLQGTRAARWLFGPEVFVYLDEVLWHKIIDLELNNTMLKDSRDPQERTKYAQARADLFEWMTEQFKLFDVMVEEYLVLRH